MRVFCWLLFFCCMPGMAGHYWPQARIDEIFNVLYTQGAGAAILEVESEDVTSYDFGIDLLMTGDRQKALAWYSALAAGGQERDRYLFGKAWVQMELGSYQDAIATAAELQNSNESDLVKARSHYLLGVIFLRSGLAGYAEEHLQQSKTLYGILGKNGGIENCEALLNYSQRKGGSNPPPVDDGNS